VHPGHLRGLRGVEGRDPVHRARVVRRRGRAAEAEAVAVGAGEVVVVVVVAPAPRRRRRSPPGRADVVVRALPPAPLRHRVDAGVREAPLDAAAAGPPGVAPRLGRLAVGARRLDADPTLRAARQRAAPPARAGLAAAACSCSSSWSRCRRSSAAAAAAAEVRGRRRLLLLPVCDRRDLFRQVEAAVVRVDPREVREAAAGAGAASTSAVEALVLLEQLLVGVPVLRLRGRG